MGYAGRMLGLAAVLLGASHPALAQPDVALPVSPQPAPAQPKLPLLLQYRVPPGCPQQADFEQTVRGFLPNLEAKAGTDLDNVEIEIEPDGQHGVLTRVRSQDQKARRAASGRNCQEVADI